MSLFLVGTLNSSCVVLVQSWQKLGNPRLDTGRKLNLHETFRRRPGHILNVFYTFNVCPVSSRVFMFDIVIYGQKQPPEVFYENRLDSGQVFSFEFCEIFRNTFFTEHLWTTASVQFCVRVSQRRFTGYGGLSLQDVLQRNAFQQVFNPFMYNVEKWPNIQ